MNTPNRKEIIMSDAAAEAEIVLWTGALRATLGFRIAQHVRPSVEVLIKFYIRLLNSNLGGNCLMKTSLRLPGQRQVIRARRVAHVPLDMSYRSTRPTFDAQTEAGL